MSAHSHTHTHKQEAQPGANCWSCFSRGWGWVFSWQWLHLRMCRVVRQLWCSFRPSHKNSFAHASTHCASPHPSQSSPHSHRIYLSIAFHAQTPMIVHLASFQFFSFFKKKKIPCHGWVFGIGATLPVLQGAMKRNPPCSIDFRGETNKKGKTDKPLWLAASRRLEREGKECEGSEQAAIAI